MSTKVLAKGTGPTTLFTPQKKALMKSVDSQVCLIFLRTSDLLIPYHHHDHGGTGGVKKRLKRKSA
jgi:hypothetical protein